MISIDGSYGEGGGQILRTCAALAAITGRSVEIENVRAGRSRPGLQPQHLAAVLATGHLCAAQMQGAEKGSTYLRFEPTKPVEPGEYRFDIGTAGSTTLVCQTVFMPLVLAGGRSTVTVLGGTHNPMAPPADYIEEVFLAAMRRAGIYAEFQCQRPGFYPVGGGEVRLSLDESGPIRALDLERPGTAAQARAVAMTGRLPEAVAIRGAVALEMAIGTAGINFEVKPRSLDSHSPGAAVFIQSEVEGTYAGFSALGERGKRMETVAEEAAIDYLAWTQTDAAVDEHLADQLVLPMAFADAPSRWTASAATEHLRTVLYVVSQFLPIRYEIAEGAKSIEVRLDPTAT